MLSGNSGLDLISVKLPFHFQKRIELKDFVEEAFFLFFNTVPTKYCMQIYNVTLRKTHYILRTLQKQLIKEGQSSLMSKLKKPNLGINL